MKLTLTFQTSVFDPLKEMQMRNDVYIYLEKIRLTDTLIALTISEIL